MKFLSTIYKFMPLRSEFITNRFLRLTPKPDLNDPYDIYPFESDVNAQNELYKSLKINKIISKDEFPLQHLNTIGITSFTEAIDNILMWSHYADSHKGMAIGFNPHHLFFKDLYRVRYTTQRPDLRKEFPNVVGVELLFKSEQWIYEKEWRIIKSFNQANKVLNILTNDISTLIPMPCLYPNLAMLEVPIDAIKSITFGVNSNIQIIEEIVEKIGSDINLSHITLQKIELVMDKFELTIVKL